MKLLFSVALVLACSCGAASAVSLPTNFSGTQGSNGLYYESIGDNRASNITNPSLAGIAPMVFDPNYAYAAGEGRPTYRYLPNNFPSVQDFTVNGKDFVVMHPGTGGSQLGQPSANIGVSIRFQASAAGWYNAAGAFAPLSTNFLAGNGVDVLVTKGSNLNSPLYGVTMDTNQAVPANPFNSVATAAFNLDVFLLAGESLRFVVFCDGQAQDGTFDSTAFKVAINPVPEPGTYALAAIGMISLLAFRRRTR